jgi:hypothetical protein
MPTFKESRAAILAALPSHGWTVETRNSHNNRPLKVPHASQGGIRLYFKAQAIYLSRFEPHSLNTAQSLTDSSKHYMGREANLTEEAFKMAGW